MTIAPGALDPVQRDPVAEKHRTGLAGAAHPMGEVVPALPEVGQRQGQAGGGADQRIRRARGGLPGVAAEQVEIEVHLRWRPEVDVAAAPAADFKPFLDGVRQLQETGLDGFARRAHPDDARLRNPTGR